MIDESSPDFAPSTFTPSFDQMAARLPRRLPEDVRQRESLANTFAKLRSRGYPCPRCRSTNTKFVGNRQCTRKPLPNISMGQRGLNFQVPVWECMTATLRGEDGDPKIPCLECPVCVQQQDLQASLRHFCPANHHNEILVPAGDKCRSCDYQSHMKCACPECLQLPHPKTFQLIFTWNPETTHASSQCLAAAGPIYRDCIDVPLYVTLLGEYQKDVQEAERRNRHISFTGVSPAVSSTLSGIFNLEDGPKLFSELQAAYPSALANLGTPESVIARLPVTTVPPRSSGGAFTQQVTFAAPNSALAKTLTKADRRTGGLLSSSPSTLLNGGFGPVRQSTTEQLNLLQSSSDVAMRTHLRTAGFPEDAIEDQVAISGLFEDYVVPYEHEVARSTVGSSSAAVRLPSSQSIVSPIVAETAVGMFIRRVQEVNLKELKKHAPNDPDGIYRTIHKSNKRSFDALMCLNGEESEKRRRIFHSATTYNDVVLNSNPGSTKEDLDVINLFIVAANQARLEADKLEKVRAGPAATDDWDDD